MAYYNIIFLKGCDKNDTATDTITESKIDHNQFTENNTDMKNMIVDKNEITIDDNSKNVVDLELRNI